MAGLAPQPVEDERAAVPAVRAVCVAVIAQRDDHGDELSAAAARHGVQ